MSYKLKNTVSIIICLIIFLIVLCYTLIFLTTVGWILTMFMLLTMITSLISFKLADVKKINIEIDDYLLINKDDEVSINITVQKNMPKFVFFPVLKVSIEELDFQKYLYGYTGKTKTMSLCIKMTKRGHYELANIELVSGDMFYLLLSSYHKKVPVDWYILPRYIKNPQSLLAMINFLVMDKQVGDMSFNIKGYRSYNHGDSMKQVDWKVSSKHQEIMVKEFSNETEEVPVFVFFGQASFYFEVLLDVYFCFFESFDTYSTSFYLIGDGVESTPVETITPFALIRKTETIDLSVILNRINHDVVLFIPEMTESIQHHINIVRASQTISIQVITYKDLKEGGYL